MIINLTKWRRFSKVAAIILIPCIGLILINAIMEDKTKPVTQLEQQKAELEMAINRDLNEQLSEMTREENNFFADYRIKRDQVRGERLELLREIASNPEAEVKARDAAELKIIALSEQVEKELQAEILIRSCGVKDCAVMIEDPQVTVIVNPLQEGVNSDADLKIAISHAIGRQVDDIHLMIHSVSP